MTPTSVRDIRNLTLLGQSGSGKTTLLEGLLFAAGAIGASLATNPALRDSVNEHIEQSVEALAPELREGLSRHIAGTVRAWNDEDLVREIEQSVGRDLQFIRLNGTLVGGLIGLVLYAVTHLIS